MGIDQQFWQVTKEQIGCESHSQLTESPKEATPKYLISILEYYLLVQEFIRKDKWKELLYYVNLKKNGLFIM